MIQNFDFTVFQLLFQMLAELQRIVGTDIVSGAKMTWQKYTPKIISQAKLERGAQITKAVSELVKG